MTELDLHPSGSFVDPTDPGEPSTGDPRLSVTRAEVALLAELVAGLSLVLEIGTGLGVSTRALASAAASVVTLDVDEWVHEHVWPTLPPNVQTLDPLRLGRDWYRSHRFGAAFVDADHSTDAAARDIDTALGLLVPTGRLLVHDCRYPSVRAALERSLPPGSWLEHDTEHGIAEYRLVAS